MKIITKNTRCLWHGRALPPLAESVQPFSVSGKFTVLFACSLYTGNELHKSLLYTLAKPGPHNPLYFYYPQVKRANLAYEYSAEDILAYYVGEGFSEVTYLFDHMQSFLIYSNTRDTFSFWVVPHDALDDRQIEKWDQAFEDHLEQVGVGFGEEGKLYIKSILDELVTLNAVTRSQSRRLFTII